MKTQLIFCKKKNFIPTQLTGFSSLKIMAAMRMKMITLLLHMVYMETVMYMKLQLLRAMSRDAVKAREHEWRSDVERPSGARAMAKGRG